jgi:predicted RNase H-like HicB family nuclease
METYALYLESGPKMRTTMVHVIDLLGCFATGHTTEDALDVTPVAIKTYKEFLQKNGEPMDAGAEFTTRVAEHVTQGAWIGYGDPESGFTPDFEPIEPADLATGLKRVSFMQHEMMTLINGLTQDEMHTFPANCHRPLYDILLHATETQQHYLTYLVGKMDALKPARAALTSDPAKIQETYGAYNQILLDRFANLSAEERAEGVPHGKMIWTARRALRRLLEHNWEHLLEIRTRLDTGE